MSCGASANIIIGITQTIAHAQALPLKTLNIKPLELMKVIATNTIVIASAPKAALTFVMIAGISIASQLLVTAGAILSWGEDMTPT